MSLWEHMSDMPGISCPAKRGAKKSECTRVVQRQGWIGTLLSVLFGGGILDHPMKALGSLVSFSSGTLACPTILEYDWHKSNENPSGWGAYRQFPPMKKRGSRRAACLVSFLRLISGHPTNFVHSTHFMHDIGYLVLLTSLFPCMTGASRDKTNLTHRPLVHGDYSQLARRYFGPYSLHGWAPATLLHHRRSQLLHPPPQTLLHPLGSGTGIGCFDGGQRPLPKGKSKGRLAGTAGGRNLRLVQAYVSAEVRSKLCHSRQELSVARRMLSVTRRHQ